MKITYIVNEITQLGGVEKVVTRLSSFFADKFNYRMKIISLNTKQSKGGFEVSPKVEVIHCGYEASEYGKRKLLNERVRKILKEEQSCGTDIIITCHGNIADLVALNKRLFKGKIVFTEHAAWEYYTKARKMAQILLYRRADKVIVLTEDSANRYRKYGLKNVVVIPNAIDEIPKAVDYKNRQHKLVAIGRLELVKGYDVLVEAVKRIKNEMGDWRVVIYGTGSEEEKIQALIDKYNLKQFISLAGITDKTTEILQESSGCLIPSRSESFSMVALEALSCGTPVVSFEFPAIKDFNATEKVIVTASPRDSYVAFADAMLRLMRDEKMREEISKKSPNVAKKYCMPEIAQRWRHLFEVL